VIPLRDNVQTTTPPIFTVFLIAFNAVVFVQQLTLSTPELRQAIVQYGLVPARFSQAVDSLSLNPSAYSPLLTSLFLHGGWFHVIGNMWYLWLFGHSVEYCLGHFNFLFFYLGCGVIASLTQVLFDPSSPLPIIGASGAVSGILGAYAICFPTARIKTLIPIIFIFTIIEVPAMLFLGLWFFLQLQSGALSMGAGSNVAWWAHIGGFAAGMLINWLWLKRGR
jgi:membrane associated rhomboid family serine protease